MVKESLYCNVKTACKMLGVKESLFRIMEKRGIIPVEVVGGQPCYPKEKLAFINPGENFLASDIKLRKLRELFENIPEYSRMRLFQQLTRERERVHLGIEEDLCFEEVEYVLDFFYPTMEERYKFIIRNNEQVWQYIDKKRHEKYKGAYNRLGYKQAQLF